MQILADRLRAVGRQQLVVDAIRERHWKRVQTIARAAAYQLASGAAEDPASAVAQVDGSVSPARRADAEWLVDQLKDQIAEDDFPAASVGEGSA